MASSGAQGVAKYLGGYKFKKRFDTGLASQLPESYRKFWREWKVMQPAAVHYIPQEGRWKRDEVTGEVRPIQNVPIPLKYPVEFDSGIWGGEAIVKGFQKRHKNNRRVPHFWVPALKRSVVRSDILDVHLSLVVTDRTLQLVHDNYGFDHYLLKTPACDLKSKLALKLKRKMLLALLDECPAYNDQPEKRNEVYAQYKKYLSAYTPEDIEWYGLSWDEAIQKMKSINADENKPKPLKHEYRSKLIEQLKASGLAEVKDSQIGSSWIAKMNPFGKKQET